ncbi:hypothetical protein Q5H92_14870 [Hymenobacter sp. M29]|uniref:Uncharacterized protein n=1 Tax=Hymenobacter mellowenesis TaxID=3063995 RepID=A0ABT9ACR6_9BACT|nr:hypothetical protein [Hymenobacter sp. M29]MDO7847649.1 hypothetical protein [Hymenobacter sp. M29]
MNRTLFEFLGVIALIIVSCFLFKGCGKTEEGGKTTVEHTTDTVYLPSKVVYQTKFVPKMVKVPGKLDTVYLTYIHSLPKDSLVVHLAQREYQDSVTLGEGLRVGYKANTRGFLDSLSFGLTDTRPITLIKDSVTITKTLPPKSHSLGIGAVVSGLGIAPGLQYTSGKSTLGIYYNLPTQPGIQGVSLSYHYSLGSW